MDQIIEEADFVVLSSLDRFRGGDGNRPFLERLRTGGNGELVPRPQTFIRLAKFRKEIGDDRLYIRTIKVGLDFRQQSLCILDSTLHQQDTYVRVIQDQ